jgi:hypothetical protein
MYKGNRSRGTTMGMIRWHRSIPLCSGCRKVRLVRHWSREKKLCAKCSRKKEITHTWSYDEEKWKEN